PLPHLPDGLGEPRQVVEHDETFHARLTEDQVEVVLRPRNRSGGVVAGDATAEHHPGAGGDARQAQIENLAADVVEVDVDAVRARAVEGLAHVDVLVVDGCVEAELAGEPAALVRATGNAHHPRALDPGDLPGDAAGGAGGAAHH